MATTEHSHSRPGDDTELSEFGYKPELKRTLGNFHTFAAGVSYISILTGTFQMFYFGFAHGGPAYWWSWPMVFLGQLMVALCFAELAAKYPVAGSIYNWAKKIGNPHIGWLAGWMMLTASIVSLAAVALSYQLTLPQISSAFQFIGTGSGTYDAAENAVLLGGVLILFTTLINAFGVKLMATINTVGVFLELLATVVLIVLFAVHIVRTPAEVLTATQHHGSGQHLGYLGAFLVASLASTYVMYGFDTAASLGEESIDPSRNAPRAIMRSLLASFVLGGLILLLALMSVHSLTGEGLSTDGLQYVVINVLGSTVGKAMLWCVLIAITVCELAVQTAAIRIAFAMSRDNNLPASSVMARVSPRFKTPVLPAVIIGALALGVLALNIHTPQVFSLITSVAIIMIYLAYLLVTMPMLLARLRGRWQPADGKFSLGRWGLLVNVLAVLWGAGMIVNLAWPRTAVYNATPPYHWYLQWGAVLFVGIVASGGFAYYWFVQRHKTGVLAEHALAAEDARTIDPEPTRV